ncbi:MAG: aminotransferase class V-fold PLP-dependent enzyme [Actinomycetota bacterium]
MKIEELRGLFPSLERVTYLNTATSAPASLPVLEAMRRVQDEWASGEFSWQAWEDEAEATRELFGGLVGGEAEHVALLASVAEAAATVAASLEPGKVVVGSLEFQSNLLPWLALERRGFEVVQVPPTDGVVRTEALVNAIDERTTLVAVSEVQSSNGFRVRLDDILGASRSSGARLFLDAIQSLGALRYVPGADYVAAHAYKWLLGPRGATWLWISPDRLEELQPLAPSWKTVPEPYADYYGGPVELPMHARRVDLPLAWQVWPAAHAGLRLVAGLDPAEVEKHCLDLAGEFREEPPAAGSGSFPRTSRARSRRCRCQIPPRSRRDSSTGK